MFQNVNIRSMEKIDQSQAVEQRESIIVLNEGQKIFAILHKPIVQTPFPLVVFLHGLGGHKVGRYRVGVDTAARLAALGIGTLRFDFRGCGDSEGDFSTLNLESQVSDTLAILNYLQGHPEIDQERIGILGRSLGGALTILSAAKFGAIKTICLWCPLFDGDQWLSIYNKYPTVANDDKKKEELMTLEGQTPSLEFFQQFFKMDLRPSLQKLEHVPILLIHGCRDENVVFEHSEKYLKHRHQAPAETRLIQLPFSDHHFTPLDERRIAINETTRWFERTL